MKLINTLRVINAAFWAVTIIAICTCVCLHWADNGCEVKSIILAICWYTAGGVGLGLIVDQHLREQLERYK